VVFVADALGTWLVEQLADAGRKKLTELLLGSEQERALRQAADAAVLATAEEMSRSGGEQAGQVAMVISEVFRDPVPAAPSAGPVMLLEGLQSGIAGQLAVLDDAKLTGTGQSSADVLGVPGAVLAGRLTGHLVREIIVRGSGGGPLTPLADQLNHELTRLQIGGMFARLAAEVRDALARPGSGVTAAGWPLEEVTDPFALEVHRPLEPDVPQPELPVLPVYVPRGHDAALAEVVTAAAAGTSGVAVLVGGSSTGKTRACWQALDLLRGLEPGWRLWHPIDPQGALAGLTGVGPRTVVWLNEAQRYLGPADGAGDHVAAGLRGLLHDRTRAPVLVLATLWSQFWDQLTARLPGSADAHAQARELLTGRDIPVPAAFTSEQLRELQDAEDPRLVQAAAGSRDGQVIQYLAGAPELLARYQHAPPAARALIDAAMDSRRLGMRAAVPKAFLEAAAPGYLTDTDWDLLPGDWLAQALGYAAKPSKGVRGPLTPIRPRPGVRASPGDGPGWQLADYLDQYGRRARRELIPPSAFWAAAASYADRCELDSLGQAAEDRGLYRDAARLYKQASAHGDPVPGAQLVRLLHTLDPGDRRPAAWATTHARLDDPGAVASLLYALREAGATGQVTTLLDRDPAAHASLDNPVAVACLLYALREAGATGQVSALLDRDPAAHVSLGRPFDIHSLPVMLIDRDWGASLLTGHGRRPANDSLGSPDDVAVLLYELDKAGASGQFTALLARAVAHASSFGDPGVEDSLLGELHEAEVGSQITAWQERDAARSRPGDPFSVTRLLVELRHARASGQLTAAADRAAEGASLDDPRGVARLLHVLREAGATSQVTVLADRAAAGASLDDPGGVAGLLHVLREAGATSQVTVLAGRAAAGAIFDARFGQGQLRLEAGSLLHQLYAAGAQAQAADLIERLPAAGLFHLFCEHKGRKEQFKFGREADGRPAERWAWTDL
jgi:hypothetical protein